jgi:hypothetical protein
MNCAPRFLKGAEARVNTEGGNVDLTEHAGTNREPA